MTIGIFSLWSCNHKKDSNIGKSKYVIVIGFDGLSPDGLKKANTPNFDRLMNEGSFSLNARAVLPTSSSTNWASMIMGAGPEQHGITSNSWEKDDFELPAVVEEDSFLFPSIFNMVNNNIENAEIGAIYHWGGFGRLFDKSAVDYDANPKTEEDTAKLASEYIVSKKPTFTFIHFDHIDHAGHKYGHGSSEYYKSVEKGDELLGEVIAAVKDAGMEEEVLIIVSSDHGGVGKGHGGESLKEVEIPFIIWGKHIKKNYKLKHPVYQYDNAATAAYALGLKMPIACIGKPVREAFVGQKVLNIYPIIEKIPAPIILPEAKFDKRAGGLFNDSIHITVKKQKKALKVKYTTDGSMPTKDSKAYISPIKIEENTVFKAAFFEGSKMMSTVETAFFRIKKEDSPKPVAYEIFFLDNLINVPDLKNLSPDIEGEIFEITSDEVKEKIRENTAVRFTTNIIVKEEETYKFYTRSDDGSMLWINGSLVVDNNGNHGVKEKVGVKRLPVGKHTIEVIWYNGGGGNWLDVYYQTETKPKQILSTSLLAKE